MSGSLTSDEALAKAKDLLAGLLAAMEFEATVEVRVQGEFGLLFAVDSSDSAVLIGRDGQMLDAIQYVMNRMLRRTLGEEWFCVLDIGGYRERRREVMAREAADIAARVRQTGRAFTFPPLSPSDRRAVHRAIADDPDLETISLEPSVDGFKRLVIQMRPSAGEAAEPAAGVSPAEPGPDSPPPVGG